MSQDPRMAALVGQSVTCRLLTLGADGVATWASAHAHGGTVYVGTSDGDAATFAISLTPYEARRLSEYLQVAAGQAELDPSVDRSRVGTSITAAECECARCPAHPERGEVTRGLPCFTCESGVHLRFMRCPHGRVLAHCADPGCRERAAAVADTMHPHNY